MADNTTPPYVIPAASSNFEQYGIESAGDRSVTTDNIFVMNAGVNPMPSFNFMLRVEGAIDVPCKSIKAFTRELEFEIIQEGGLNDYVHMRRKPISKPFYIEVERYVGTDYVDPLPLGAELLLPLVLMISRMAGRFVPAARTYTFSGCTVTKKTYGDLVSEQSGLYVETTTIAYREMTCVDLPGTEDTLPNYGDDPKKSLSIERTEAEEKAEKERLQRLAEFEKTYSGGHDVPDSQLVNPKARDKTGFDKKYEDGHTVNTKAANTSETTPEEPLSNTDEDPSGTDPEELSGNTDDDPSGSNPEEPSGNTDDNPDTH